MPVWNPKPILEEPGLRLTEAEKQVILQKMPLQPNGEIYADAIFEGGGVKGTAFLGALRCCHDLGIRWRKLAGTSAGAITAALLSANLSIDDLENILGELNYMNFLTQKTSPLILNGSPDDDLESPLWMMISLTVAGRLGEYSSDPFRNWLRQVLTTGKLTTFADVEPGRALKVVVSDITRGEMLVLPDALENPALLQKLGLTHPNEFSVAEAVRLSMSIPFFFEPGRLGDSLIVDGGILSNFPLWIYDVNPATRSQNQPPRWPTFGFRLVEADNRMPKEIRSPFKIMAAMVRTMMVAKDRFNLREIDQGRVIHIDTTSAQVTATQFNLSNQKKDELYRVGYQKTKQFFLQTWSWAEHLKARGYDSTTAA